MPVIAMGNAAIAVPSESYPLIAGDLYQLFDTSDLPGGAINIVTGYSFQLLKVLAEHDDVDAIWCFCSKKPDCGHIIVLGQHLKKLKRLSRNDVDRTTRQIACVEKLVQNHQLMNG